MKNRITTKHLVWHTGLSSPRWHFRVFGFVVQRWREPWNPWWREFVVYWSRGLGKASFYLWNKPRTKKAQDTESGAE
jgi:hypothetical protein